MRHTRQRYGRYRGAYFDEEEGGPGGAKEGVWFHGDEVEARHMMNE